MESEASYVLVPNKECLHSLEQGKVHYYCIHESSLPDALSKGFIQHGGFTCNHNGEKHRYFYVTPYTYGTLHCSCGQMELVRGVPILFEPPSDEVLSLNARISLLKHAPYNKRCSSCDREPTVFQVG